MLGPPGSQGEEFCDRQLNKMSWEREFLTVKRMVRHWYRLATLWNSSGLWLELPLLYGTQVTRSQFCFWDIWSLVLLSYPEALSDLVTLEVTSRLPKVSKDILRKPLWMLLISCCYVKVHLGESWWLSTWVLSAFMPLQAFEDALLELYFPLLQMPTYLQAPIASLLGIPPSLVTWLVTEGHVEPRSPGFQLESLQKVTPN